MNQLGTDVYNNQMNAAQYIYLAIVGSIAAKKKKTSMKRILLMLICKEFLMRGVKWKFGIRIAFSIIDFTYKKLFFRLS